MKVKREYKSNTVIVVLVLLIVFYFGLRLGTLVELNDGEWSFEVLNQASDQFFSFEPLIFNQFTLMIGSFLALFSWMIYETLHSSYKRICRKKRLVVRNGMTLILRKICVKRICIKIGYSQRQKSFLKI